jgi:hypothetical protein
VLFLAFADCLGREKGETDAERLFHTRTFTPYSVPLPHDEVERYFQMHQDIRAAVQRTGRELPHRADK